MKDVQNRRASRNYQLDLDLLVLIRMLLMMIKRGTLHMSGMRLVDRDRPHTDRSLKSWSVVQKRVVGRR